jgi:O-antigen ligase
MGKLCNPVFFVTIFTIFLSIFFANFLFMPLGDYTTQRIMLTHGLSIFVVFSLAFLAWRHGCKLFMGLWPAFMISVIFSLSAIVFNKNAFGVTETGMYAAFFVGFVLLGFLSKSLNKTHDWVLLFSYLAALMTAFYGAVSVMIYLFLLSDGVAVFSDHLPWGFVNIRYWSHIATWLLPILPLAALVGPLKDKHLWRFLVAFGSSLMWWIVFLSAARGSILGITFGVMLAAVLIGRSATPWLFMFLRYLVLGLLIWVLLSVVIPSFIADDMVLRSIKTTTSGRMPLFTEAWYMSLENFPFGMGPQSWLTHEILSKEYLRSPKFGHPHNMYLMWAAEYGWLLIGALLVFAVQSMRLFWRQRSEVRAANSSEPALLLAAFTASVCAALFHAGVSAVFIAPGSMLIGFFVLGLFWALIAPVVVVFKQAQPKRRLVFVGLLVVIVGTLCTYWLDDVWGYHTAMRDDLDFYQKNVPIETFPRFWSHGNFPRHPDQMP